MNLQPAEFPGPKNFQQALLRVERIASGTSARPPYDYADLVERFSRGEELSAGDQRKLPYALLEGTPPLLERPNLEGALAEMSRLVRSGRSRPMQGAIFCLLQVRPGHSNGLALLRQWVRKHLEKYGPRHRVLGHWTTHAALFGENGPQVLAEMMLQASDFQEGLRHSQVPSQCWLVEEALPILGRRTAVECHQKRADLYAFLERGHRHLIPKVVETSLLRLLEPGTSSSRVPEIETFFVRNLGHPSLDSRGLWQTVSEPARALARRWLNEKNIKLFYEHIVRSGDRHRLAFWLQFLDDGVDDVRIVVGPNDSKSHNEEIRKAIDTREIAGLHGGPAPNVSAVFLKLKSIDWWIVEFSQVGNATYAYRSGHKRPNFWWGKNTFHMEELKQGGTNWPYRVIHPGGYLDSRAWQQEYANKLRSVLHGEFPQQSFRPRA